MPTAVLAAVRDDDAARDSCGEGWDDEPRGELRADGELGVPARVGQVAVRAPWAVDGVRVRDAAAAAHGRGVSDQELRDVLVEDLGVTEVEYLRVVGAEPEPEVM